jgi:hypothetical protein
LALRPAKKLDGNAAEYHNEVQILTAWKNDIVGKNKSLRQKNKGISLSELTFEYVFLAYCILISCLGSLQSWLTRLKGPRGSLLTCNWPITVKRQLALTSRQTIRCGAWNLSMKCRFVLTVGMIC